MTNFFWLAHSACGNLGCHAGQHRVGCGPLGLGFGLCEAGETACVGCPRQHVVDGDAVDGHLRCPCFGPIRHGPADGVDTPARRGALTDVQTRSMRPNPALHPRQHRLADLVVDEVLVEGGQEGVLGSFRDWSTSVLRLSFTRCARSAAITSAAACRTSGCWKSAKSWHVLHLEGSPRRHSVCLGFWQEG